MKRIRLSAVFDYVKTTLGMWLGLGFVFLIFSAGAAPDNATDERAMLVIVVPFALSGVVTIITMVSMLVSDLRRGFNPFA